MSKENISDKKRKSIQGQFPDQASDSIERDLDAKDFTSTLPASEFLESYYQRHEELRDMPPAVIRRAWFTMAHLTLNDDAKILDIGCGEGAITFSMAALNPKLNYIGLCQSSRLLRRAQRKYDLPNLTFIKGDISDQQQFANNTYDAVINGFTLHEIYTANGLNELPVIEHLEHSYRILKPHGRMFIHAYAAASPNEYVQIELPVIRTDTEKNADTPVDQMSSAELLLWYSEHARPNSSGGYDGFFIEELPAQYANTRLFRLPYKWAYEYILRKYDVISFEQNIDKQFTFFTHHEFRKHLRALGCRLSYSAPYFNEQIIKKQYEGKFRLYDQNGERLSYPETSFVAVIQKIEEGRSLQLHERRASKEAPTELTIHPTRNKETGKIYDIVSRGIEYTDIIPYRLDKNGELYVYIYENAPRGICRTVPRDSIPIDGKIWSGHLTEAISIPTEDIVSIQNEEYEPIVDFFDEQLGMYINETTEFTPGPSYLPAPDFIDERVHTLYLSIPKQQSPIIRPKHLHGDLGGFSSTGYYSEIRAQSIMNALAVGFIPNARLEMQLQHLYTILNLKYESWSECPLKLELRTPENITSAKELLELFDKEDARFEKSETKSGDTLTLKSTFVDEGFIDGGIKGISSKDMEFALQQDKTTNIAVVLPLTRNTKSQEVMMGIVTEFLPVPQRYKKSGMCISAPSYKLPNDIQDMEEAKIFIAKDFKVTSDKVSPLGPSYFCHVGVSPIRIFPFAVAAAKAGDTPFGGPVQFIPTAELYEILRLFDRNLYFSGLSTLMGMYKAALFAQYDNEEHRFNWVEGRIKYHGFMPAGTIESDTVNSFNHITAELRSKIDKKISAFESRGQGSDAQISENDITESPSFMSPDMMDMQIDNENPDYYAQGSKKSARDHNKKDAAIKKDYDSGS